MHRAEEKSSLRNSRVMEVGLGGGDVLAKSRPSLCSCWCGDEWEPEWPVLRNLGSSHCRCWHKGWVGMMWP